MKHVKWRVRLGRYCVELHHGTLMWTLPLISLATARLHGRLGQDSSSKPVPEYNSTQYCSSLKSTRLCMANKTVPVTAGLATCRVRYLFSTYYFTQIIKIFSLNVKKKKNRLLRSFTIAPSEGARFRLCH